VFHTKEYDEGRKTYNNGVCVKRSTSNEFEADYFRKLEEIIEFQYYNKNIIFYSNIDISMIPLIKESE